jgi:hypothetical protein
MGVNEGGIRLSQYPREIALFALTVFCLYRVLSTDRISVVGIAIGAGTVLLLWVVSDASVGPVVPSLGEISGREFIDAVVIVPLIGFIALGFVSSVTEVSVSTPQYYGLILGAVGGVWLSYATNLSRRQDGTDSR